MADPHRDRAEVLRALLLAGSRAAELVDLATTSTSEEQLVQRLGAAFGVSELAARAVIDMQVRRLVLPHQERLRRDLVEVERGLAEPPPPVARDEPPVPPLPELLASVRTAYDTLAPGYAEQFRGELDGKPWDRALLGAFAEVVRAAGAGRVADVGCGPGRVTALLVAHGLDAYGVDLSPGMLAVARSEHPDLTFVEASLTDLAEPDGALAAVVAWYSLIHLPLEHLPVALAELTRVLRPDGHLLLAFQTRADTLVVSEAYDREVQLEFLRHDPEAVGHLLGQAGFAVISTTVRAAGPTERVPQAVVVARRLSAGPASAPAPP